MVHVTIRLFGPDTEYVSIVIGNCREDLEKLARTRGKNLRVLKISVCDGYWENGFVTLERDKYEVEDLTLLARKCSKSLVSLRIHPCSLSFLGDAFIHAVRLEDFPRAFYDPYSEGEDDYVGFKLPPNMLRFGTYDLPVTLLTSLLPHGNQLRELNLPYRHPRPICWCSLIKSCPNLEVTYTGLIALAEGCTNLEYLKVSTLKDMSNEAMECLGTHLRNLRKFSRISDKIYGKADIALDNGIRVMLMGCSKLERLHISLY
ncbi:hypothetical protein CTI12_AA346640 [Artemisia annua]|uniref:Uncharacterized protein n=1 Tax=Artemisia annua TaxID=35608 RepID=A0A2U1MSE7_ARTAN|nr:hypothetical protein CTI12_AA346640 [Artemisia annua]